MTFRTPLVSVLLLSFVLAGNVYAETVKEKFDRAVQYTEQQNYQAAIPIFKELAEQGYASAQNNLGFMYNNGYGVSQDYHHAVKWYQKAAEQGYVSAQYNLGLMYGKGQGVRQNLTIADMWIVKSCDNGNQSACDLYHKLYKAK